MKRLLVPFIENSSETLFWQDLPVNFIDHQPWPQYHTKCSAAFRIAHSNTAVLLKFRVSEDVFKTAERNINDAVHKDNCVEFFIAFGEEQDYYNFEFNCLGVGKVGFGSSREDRLLLPENIIRLVTTDLMLHSRSSAGTASFNWEITLSVPVEAFHYHRISSLKGLRCRANFYKCGDDLPEPHFLSWTMIHTEEPDFHQPAFFGGILFG
ncbi:carbohydrate-binding family 9-like protein [Pararcticibacter amylolyticus]|uniref:Carbohydrate-binding domain-containing protein n=1 Tax=Pararcticibacter amylolyticus TaxID=2173175 RepID=A0A2U2PKK5_9SPHI|nr:carbohydrate-binding family 9-like protein [Pararcticibacter amylolyticus]PWG81947.1 hypothetical protein DDR33_02650 [Pararcticibacter amylolyticus]